MITGDRGRQFLAIVVVTSLLVFGVVLQGEFVLWDDDINIYLNPKIQRLTTAEVAWMFGDIQHALRYKPLSWLTWALLHQAFGLNPVAYHAANLVLHSINAGLLFLVIAQLLKLVAHGNKPVADLSAYAAGGALFWAVNPLRVEVVAWSTGLPYCLALMLLLISVLCWLNYFAGGGKWFYGASVVAFGLSLLTYPIGLTYPLALAILHWFLRSTGSLRASFAARDWIQHVPFLLMMALFVSVAAYGRMSASGEWSKPVSLAEFGLPSRIMQAAYIIIYYLWKPFAPVGLSPVYTTLVYFKPLAGAFVLSLAAIAVISALCLKNRKRPALLALWLCHGAILIPVLGLTEHPHYPSDRYGYVAGTILAVAVAFAFRLFHGRRSSTFVAIAGIAVMGLFSVLSVRQATVWKSSVDLFTYIIPRVRDPLHLGDLWRRLGLAYGAEGDLTQAEGALQQAIATLPTPKAHYALAQVLRMQGRTDEALFQAREAVGMDPKFSNAYVEAAMALEAQGKIAEAVENYQSALAHNPDAVDALNSLAWIRATHTEAAYRDGAQAVSLAERACALTAYNQVLIVGTLAAAYAENGRFEEAIRMGEKAVTLASAAGNHDLAEAGRKMVEGYRAGRPYRQGSRQAQ